MKSITVNLKHCSYDILIEGGLIKKMGSLIKSYTEAKKCLIVTDTNVYPLYAKGLAGIIESEGISCPICVLEAGEENKSIENVLSIYESLAKNGLGRNDIIIVLGGGVIGDMAGFAASTWVRGIRFVQIPTTLLACVDSSVGGKTGINTAFGKNLVGTFAQPSLVLIDSQMLSSLNDREFFAGMAEVVKHAILFDKPLFEMLEQNYSREAIIKNIDEILYTNCKIKAHIVEIDEKEKYERMMLNFGHTLGHAVEQGAGYGTYLHGEAVAIGIIFALEYGLSLGITKNATVLDRAKVLLDKLNLPTSIPSGLDLQYSIKQDKKKSNKDINFIFVEDFSIPKIVAIAIDDICKQL